MPSTDPTRTKTRRERFRRRFHARWRDVRGAVRTEFEGGSDFQPLNDRSPSRQVADFREWFDALLAETVVEPIDRTRDVRDGAHWTAPIVRELYRHGIAEADRRLRDAGWQFSANTTHVEAAANHDPEATVRRAQRRLERSVSDHHGDALEAAYLDTYHDVDDAAAGTVQETGRTYREAVRDGVAVGAAIALVNDRVDKVGRHRTDLVADSRAVETVNTAVLNRYEEVGVTDVGVDIEVRVDGGEGKSWQTAGDDAVCAECAALEGNTYPISDIKAGNTPRPPLHPRCRCVFAPIDMNP